MMIETAACWLNAVLPTWYRINFGVTQLIVHILIGASLHGLVCLVYYTNVPSFQKVGLRNCRSNEVVRLVVAFTIALYRS